MSLPSSLQCWAVTAPGLEHLAVAELTAMSVVVGEVEPGGVGFTASEVQLAQVLLGARTINRVTVRLAAFKARTFAELEKHATAVPWQQVLPSGSAIHFRVTSKKSRLYHNDAIAERLERMALAAVPGTTAVRAPSAAEAMEDDLRSVPGVQRVVVRVFRDGFTLSADASGALLHLRGWRQAVARAPMRETLAAALLQASGWGARLADTPLLDPFCGSGTIAIEAALQARRVSPGIFRRFAAEAWPMLSAASFDAARTQARAAELPRSPVEIIGCDRDDGAVRAAMANAERAGVADDVRFSRATISQLPPDDGEGDVVTNPPYGARIGERTALRDLYATLGRVMAERRPGWRLTMLSADPMLEGQVARRLTELARTTNGGIPVRIVSTASG